MCIRDSRRAGRTHWCARSRRARVRASHRVDLLLPFRAVARGDSVAAHLVQWDRSARRSRHCPLRLDRCEPHRRVFAPVHHLSRRGRRQPAGRARLPRAHSPPPGRGASREVHVTLRRPTLWLASAVFLLAAIIYFITLTPTVPFWDSGEFIAVSYI